MIGEIHPPMEVPSRAIEIQTDEIQFAIENPISTIENELEDNLNNSIDSVETGEVNEIKILTNDSTKILINDKSNS
jgi:hypothetical protein